MVFMQSAYFFKCRIKLACQNYVMRRPRETTSDVDCRRLAVRDIEQGDGMASDACDQPTRHGNGQDKYRLSLIDPRDKIAL